MWSFGLCPQQRLLNPSFAEAKESIEFNHPLLGVHRWLFSRSRIPAAARYCSAPILCLHRLCPVLTGDVLVYPHKHALCATQEELDRLDAAALDVEALAGPVHEQEGRQACGDSVREAVACTQCCGAVSGRQRGRP